MKGRLLGIAMALGMEVACATTTNVENQNPEKPAAMLVSHKHVRIPEEPSTPALPRLGESPIFSELDQLRIQLEQCRETLGAVKLNIDYIQRNIRVLVAGRNLDRYRKPNDKDLQACKPAKSDKGFLDCIKKKVKIPGQGRAKKPKGQSPLQATYDILNYSVPSDIRSTTAALAQCQVDLALEANRLSVWKAAWERMKEFDKTSSVVD